MMECWNIGTMDSDQPSIPAFDSSLKNLVQAAQKDLRGEAHEDR